jgi:UDP-N-acetylglucosamine--N-acetylmuramyl-(pentapeptide) pyrophosphoryl-undecaprenol N-acetylglucosamine transferase
MRVVIAGGGTAGHVYPGLALAHELGSRGVHVAFAGTERGLEARLVPEAGFEFHAVEASPFVRRVSVATFRAPLVAMRAMARSGDLVSGADVVVGMGGYVSVPVALAARRARIPMVLHEQNAVPGLANRVLSRVAASVGLTFAAAAPRFPRRVRPRLTITGDPVREEILRVPAERDTLAKEGRRELGLDDARRTIVVFGGSQGALHVDRAAAGATRLLRGRSDLQVLLIAGPAHVEVVRRALPAQRDTAIVVRILGYLDRMDWAYACADLVVARAGATTIAELTAVGLPSLLVPYPYATGRHQEANARAVQRAGGASVLLDDQLTAESLGDRIESLVDHEERLRAMADRARAFGRPDAAVRLADLVERAARR